MKVFLVGCALLSLALAEPPASNYLPSRQGFGGGGAPSQNYGAPQKSSSQYSAPSSGHGGSSRSSQSYSAPSQNYGAPSQSYSAPSQSYGAPSQSYGAPSQSYGAPAKQGYGDQYDEPAHYNFEYTVKDDHYGTDFGHKESREGDRAEGVYYVLLPDGRKQIVKYEADAKGYRPMITYEEGYGSGPANGGYGSGKPSGGYSSGGY